MKGRNEWDRQVVNLKQLASAYATTFPLPDGAAVRRMNDRETAGAAGAIGAAAGRFKNDLDNDRTLAKADRNAAKRDVDLLIKQADAVKSRTSAGRPATADMQQVVDQVARLEEFVGSHPNTNVTNWQAVRTSLDKLQQAFGVTP